MNHTTKILRRKSIHRTSKKKTLFHILLIFVLIGVFSQSTLVFAVPINSSTHLQTPPQAQTILERMTTQERIGQLFLVTFTGSDVTTGSAIERLISENHIGGVVLLAENDNIQGGEKILESLVTLNRQLQTNAWNSSQNEILDETSGKVYRPVYIPLFIGINQEGDGPPYNEVLSGLTQLPNEMTIGATWDTDLAAQAGVVLGEQLSTLGINLLFGPSLDVLESPDPESGKSLGTRSFGGDPSWVAKMGQSYIQGIHLGSRGTLAVIAKYFPGYGSADRIPEEEVATVRKSLNDLKEYDLIPFYAVTGDAPNSSKKADALLSSHIRFQGYQGSSPRAITRPVSIDQAVFNSLLELPPIQKWRQDGGLIVSDDLGGAAIRGFQNLNSQSYDPRRITLNALLAGNDLLFVSDFTNIDQPDPFLSIVETIDYLDQKYREDPAFAQRVDDAVIRILTVKLRLYGSFTPTRVLPSEGMLSSLTESSKIPFNIIRNASTLINPTQDELDDFIPDPPDRTDRIVFITDSRPYKQCSKCLESSALEKDALENVVLRRYGPSAGRLVVPSNLVSFTIEDLDNLLNNQAPESEIERRIALSHWIVFSMLDNSDEYPSYATLSKFLARRPDLVQGKKLILFAFNAPYFLNATDISKLSAFYSLYSKTQEAVDMAAYLLFQELPAMGTLPVSVEGINYNLNEALFPDPNQVIELSIDLPTNKPSNPIDVQTPEPPPVIKIGDVVPLMTGTIYDQNGHIVPDGTPVEFSLSVGNESPDVQQIEYTQNGIASTNFLITSGGSIILQAQSEQAISNQIRLEIPLPGEATPTSIPTPEPTETPTPTITPTSTPEPTPVPVTTIIYKPQFSDWVMVLLLAILFGWIVYRTFVSLGQLRWGVRIGIFVLIGCMLAYTYIVLNFPGINVIRGDSYSLGILLITFLGGVIGLIIAVIWFKVVQNKWVR